MSTLDQRCSLIPNTVALPRGDGSGATPRAVIWLIVALGLTLRTIAIAHFEPLDHVGASDRANVAYALLHGGGYADAYGPGSGPTAHFSPLYTFVLTGVYGVFGFGRAGVVAAQVLGLATVAAVIMLLLPLASACGLPRISAYLGGLIFAAPTSMIAEDGGWETPLTAVFVCLTIMGAETLYRQKQWTSQKAVLAGLFLGAALLTSPPLVLWFGFLAAGVFFVLKQRRFVVLAAAVAFLTLLPWMVRNQLVLGSPIWSRSNFGLEFDRAHNDQTCVEFWDCYNTESYQRNDLTFSETERKRVAEMGEVAYNRQKMEQGLGWALAHPRREASLLAGRIFRFWFPSPRRNVLQAVILWSSAILCLIGMATWFRVSSTSAWVVSALMFTFPLIYYATCSMNRYRYPLTPVVVLFAGDLLRRLALTRKAELVPLARTARA